MLRQIDILSQPKVAFLNSSQGLESSPVTFHFLDTVIPHELLANELYQANLKTIDNFLLCGKGVWWHVEEESKEIVFHDNKGRPEFQEHGPPLYHFRSHSFETEKIYLKEKSECLSQSTIRLPIRKVKCDLTRENVH